MALHNYIYSKHQTDVTTDNKIAREHEPRPVCLDIPTKETVVTADADTDHHAHHQHHAHHHVDHRHSTDHHSAHINDRANQIICNVPPHDHHIIHVHESGSTVDVKGTYEDELAHEGDDEEEEDSSDSDFLRAHAHKYENHCHRHGNTHNNINHLYPHPPIQSIIEEVDEPHENDSIVIVKTSSDESEAIIAMEKAQQRESKWVFVDGKKKKLKSRFSKSTPHHIQGERITH